MSEEEARLEPLDGEVIELYDTENRMDEDDMSVSSTVEEPQETDLEDGPHEDHGVALERMMHSFHPHNGEPVYSVAVHPSDRTLVATGGGDDFGRLFRYVQMEEDVQHVADLGGHSDSVISVSFSSDGSLLATAGMDGLVKIWDGTDGKEIQTLEGPNEVTWIDWHPRGPVIAAGSEDGTVWMWNAQSGACMRVFTGNSIRSNAGMFSPDGKWLVTCGEGYVYVWDPKEGNAKVAYDRSQGHSIGEVDYISLAINPACTVVAAGAVNGSVAVLHLLHFQILQTLASHSDAVEGLGFSPKLNVLASAGLDSKLVLWDMNNYSVRFQCETEEVTTLKCVPDPATIITASTSGIVSVRDARSGALLDQMGLQDGTCLDMCPIPDMQLLFCAYENGRLVSFAYN